MIDRLRALNVIIDRWLELLLPLLIAALYLIVLPLFMVVLVWAIVKG